MDRYIFTPVWIVGGILILILGFYIEGEETDDDEENETENEENKRQLQWGVSCGGRVFYPSSYLILNWTMSISQ